MEPLLLWQEKGRLDQIAFLRRSTWLDDCWHGSERGDAQGCDSAAETVDSIERVVPGEELEVVGSALDVGS